MIAARSAAIRVELPEGELTADFLDRTRMRTPSGTYVPLSDIVTVESRSGFSTVRRENGVRMISVTGDISDDDPARAAGDQDIRHTPVPIVLRLLRCGFTLHDVLQIRTQIIAQLFTCQPEGHGRLQET